MSEEISQDRESSGVIVKITSGVLVLAAVGIVGWNTLADRYAPSTSRSTVTAQVIQIAPRVPGRTDQVFVRDNQLVQQGDALFHIDDETYRLAAQSARVQLQNALQGVEASTSRIAAAQAQVAQARVNLEKTEADTKRAMRLVERGVVSEVRGQDAERALTAARATLEAAVSQAEAAQQQLGDAANNPQVKAARLALEKAEYDLASTVVTAPSFGAISNLKLAPGQFVGAGTPVITFIDAEDIWITANLRENQLGNVTSGDRVTIAFDAIPGKVFEGTLDSIGWGINATPRQAGGLPVSTAPTEWFEPARRIPVRIDLAALPLVMDYPLRLGGKADVVIHTGENGIISGLASMFQRVRSTLSYLY
ncbi:HlyD family secretion protein [Thalassovita mediterranea]|jgi:multidrug resistance efflux pump|uniref:Multidrug resistance protein MdtN n=2 Tax=Thalassovita mediterranea TaxID=340021 RepID=A0A0P1HDE4_9RHOB|nr:HlyD family secretion protein [Thalassovita mediterranea]CUH84894.1 Multidrug resistance protein MdtN [Thalassovita mediterranea]SIS29100.1 Multidrug resistance efflux pump [Thalassovita mediterranea]